ncbi:MULTISPECIES: HAD family hydrolase [unclassified Clostridium]|uniref:Cof-type HAD-IIB family hydrolase n=1 Tax=unclassified Clostridium TaxID=2614128 RepID=UPI0002979202|nr:MULTISPECIES: HAD family hydrolase [unclassified Clostridium]EKQ57555.1 MAG: HAD-superfamily hydrolase, subfamily IIB [Clostridium sp. Maddingley MBC34-26]
MDLSNVLFVSDMDETLFNSDKVITDENIKAIRMLQNHGGTFTVATGRSVTGFLPYKDIIKPDIPVILYNGAVIYDIKNDKIIWSTILGEDVRRNIKNILKAFPSIGVQVMSVNGVFSYNSTPEFLKFMDRERLPFIKVDSIDEFPDEWIKVEMTRDLVDKKGFNAYIEDNHIIGHKFIHTGDCSCEIVRENVSKGDALKRLIDQLEFQDKQVYCIGDHNNDIEMITYANIGFAVSNSLDKVKAVANIVVSSCDDNPISEAVSYIIKNNRNKSNL